MNMERFNLLTGFIIDVIVILYKVISESELGTMFLFFVMGSAFAIWFPHACIKFVAVAVPLCGYAIIVDWLIRLVVRLARKSKWLTNLTT